MQPEKRKVHTAKLVTLLIVLVLAAIIVFQNVHLESIPFEVLFWQLPIAPILVVGLAAVIGFVAGYLLATFRKTSKKGITS